MDLTKRVLKHKTKAMTFDWPMKNDKLASKLLSFMVSQNGIGLAANQVGIAKRLFVIRHRDVERRCFNPTILRHLSDFVLFDEGCLSFPGDSCTISRPNTIDVLYYDSGGQEHQERLTGLLSRVYQHELDHLNGITMWDRYKEQNAN